MSSNVLLIIFLLVWATIGGYLFYLDKKVKKLKEQFELKSELD